MGSIGRNKRDDYKLTGGVMFYINPDIETEKRYDPSKFIEFTDHYYDVLGSHLFNNIKSLPMVGRRMITVIDEARPDLLSYNLYGDVQFWWLLLLYNDLAQPSDLKTGLVIKYPSLSKLEELYFRLNALSFK